MVLQLLFEGIIKIWFTLINDFSHIPSMPLLNSSIRVGRQSEEMKRSAFEGITSRFSTVLKYSSSISQKRSKPKGDTRDFILWQKDFIRTSWALLRSWIS